MKNIGIVGTGNMGRVIGLALAQKGYPVFFGARDLPKAEFAASFDPQTQFGTNQQAAEFGDILYYAPRDVDPKDVLEDTRAFDGKIVIESGNVNISADLDADDIKVSKTEILQRQIPDAMVVKAFNTIIQEIFEYTAQDLTSFNISCFLASDFPEATATVSNLVKDLGFVPVDCGLAKQAVLLEQAGSLIRVLARMKQTPWLSFSLSELPKIEDLKFGGRTVSGLHNHASYLKK